MSGPLPGGVDTSGVANVLARIVEGRVQRLGDAGQPLGLPPASDGSPIPSGADDAAAGEPGGPFLEALRRRRGNAVIAEVKLGSPKLGDLRGRIDPEAQARTYAAGGAAALSVVVEPDHFFGGYDVLERCRRASGLPAIAKDFVVSESQLVWAREAGADAVLLIAALYAPRQLRDYADAALALGLVPLIETHSQDDVARLGGIDEWDLVGVNNRDLRTFAVDLQHSLDLLPSLPPGALKVAESGLSGRAQIERLAAAGFDAFLIGEALLLADDPAAKLAELLGGQG